MKLREEAKIPTLFPEEERRAREYSGGERVGINVFWKPCDAKLGHTHDLTSLPFCSPGRWVFMVPMLIMGDQG